MRSTHEGHEDPDRRRLRRDARGRGGPGAGIGAPPAAGADKVDGGPGNDRCIVDVADVVVKCETLIRVPAGP